MKTPNSSMLKSGGHKDELAKDITHETDKLSVGFNFDVHYKHFWFFEDLDFNKTPNMQQHE